MDSVAQRLAEHLSLGELLAALGRYQLLAHHRQGEFHHDVVVRAGSAYLAVATNCNGGVKEVLCFDEEPSVEALWRFRCPDNEAFRDGPELPAIRGRARTTHWFDPCELLGPDARSELRPEFRKRQRGGGWEPAC